MLHLQPEGIMCVELAEIASVVTEVDAILAQDLVHLFVAVDVILILVQDLLLAAIQEEERDRTLVDAATLVDVVILEVEVIQEV